MDWQIVAIIISIIVAIISIVVSVIAGYKVVYKINHKLDKVVIMQPSLMKSLFACLDGLHQLGANGKVSEARAELLETLINE